MAAGKCADSLATLLQAAFALPVLALPMRTVAAESGEAGFAVLTYRERGLMKVTEPMGWVRMQLEDGWDIRAGAVLDVVTGASPRFVTNEGGAPVQSVTGASIDDRRRGADVRIGKRVGEFRLAVSRTRSDEDDYRSRAFGTELQLGPRRPAYDRHRGLRKGQRPRAFDGERAAGRAARHRGVPRRSRAGALARWR